LKYKIYRYSLQVVVNVFHQSFSYRLRIPYEVCYGPHYSLQLTTC
jgi:hypothetical protein